MNTSTNQRRGFRVRAMLVPTVMMGGALAAGLVVLSDFSGAATAYSPLEPSAFQDIAFVANFDQPEAIALRTALAETCDRTGCDADVLHPMILASVDRMTSGELVEALDAQARIQAESVAVRARSLPGTDMARMAELEILAAERIAALYEVELARR